MKQEDCGQRLFELEASSLTIDGSQNQRNEPFGKPPEISQLSSQSSVSSGVDSGYGSASNSPNNDNSNQHQLVFRAGILLPSAKLPQRKAKTLKFFDKEIPYSTQVRYADIHELLLGTCIYHYLAKASISCTDIAIKLKVLGESEESAKPWILVLCPKKASKRVKQFFNQKYVKSEYQPSDTDLSRPSFEILVSELPPRLMALTPNLLQYSWKLDYEDLATSNVYGNVRDINNYAPTLCGAAIRVCIPNTLLDSRTATLGGVIKVITSMENFELYGMTAGHIITGKKCLWLHSSVDFLFARTGSAGSDEVVDDSDDRKVKSIAEVDDGEYSSEEDDYILDWNQAEEQPTSQIWPISDASNSSTLPDSGWCNLGRVAAVSHDSEDYRGNLDWALVTINDTSFCRPNQLLYKNAECGAFEMKNLSGSPQTPTNPSSTQSVVLLSGTNGPREGKLSRTPAFIMLAPGKDFKKTYTLTFDDNSGKIFLE